MLYRPFYLPLPPQKNGIISYTDSQYFKSVGHLTDKDFAYFVFTKDGKLSICLLSEVWPYFYPNFFFFFYKIRVWLPNVPVLTPNAAPIETATSDFTGRWNFFFIFISIVLFFRYRTILYNSNEFTSYK